MKTHNIASFDGGGVKGRMSLELAAEIEQRTGLKFGQMFPIIGGTSTGGIIAALLAIGYPARQIADIYDRECEKIFKKSKLRWGIFQSKYSHKYLEKMLSKYLGDKRMRDLKTRLIMPAYQQDIDELVVFDSASSAHAHLYLSDVVRATSAAPTYFRPHKFNHGLYSDGGTILNNPTLWAYLEAMAEGGFDARYNIVSIGTSRQENPVFWKGGIVGWIAKLIPNMMRNQVKLQHQITNKICSGLADNYWRLEPTRELSSGKMDDASKENMRNMQVDGMRSVDIYNNEIDEITHELIR